MGTGSLTAGAGAGASFGATLGPWGALAGGVAGGLASMFLGDEAAEAKKKAALERARRADAQNQATLGTATAAAGASGLDLNGKGQTSMGLYLSGMAQEFRRQNDWNVSQANRAADIEETGNLIGGLKDIGGSMFSFGQSKKWWGVG